MSLGSDHPGSGLGDLLPSVFGGTSSNVTTCLECGRESTRNEDFMELTIPIIEPEKDGGEEEEEEPSGKKSGRKKGASKSARRDIDVQQCFDAHLHPESLEGDNQYECSR